MDIRRTDCQCSKNSLQGCAIYHNVFIARYFCNENVFYQLFYPLSLHFQAQEVFFYSQTAQRANLANYHRTNVFIVFAQSLSPKLNQILTLLVPGLLQLVDDGVCGLCCEMRHHCSYSLNVTIIKLLKHYKHYFSFITE